MEEDEKPNDWGVICPAIRLEKLEKRMEELHFTTFPKITSYVLMNEINGSTLHGLLSEALRLGLEHGLRIRAITMDGLSANLTAMRMFGCKLSKSLENIDGQF